MSKIVWVHAEHNLCDGCYFEHDSFQKCSIRPCCPDENADGRPRIAILEKDSNDE